MYDIHVEQLSRSWIFGNIAILLVSFIQSGVYIFIFHTHNATVIRFKGRHCYSTCFALPLWWLSDGSVETRGQRRPLPVVLRLRHKGRMIRSRVPAFPLQCCTRPRKRTVALKRDNENTRLPGVTPFLFKYLRRRFRRVVRPRSHRTLGVCKDARMGKKGDVKDNRSVNRMKCWYLDTCCSCLLAVGAMVHLSHWQSPGAWLFREGWDGMLRRRVVMEGRIQRRWMWQRWQEWKCVGKSEQCLPCCYWRGDLILWCIGAKSVQIIRETKTSVRWMQLWLRSSMKEREISEDFCASALWSTMANVTPIVKHRDSCEVGGGCFSKFLWRCQTSTVESVKDRHSEMLSWFRHEIYALSRRILREATHVVSKPMNVCHIRCERNRCAWLVVELVIPKFSLCNQVRESFFSWECAHAAYSQW